MISWYGPLAVETGASKATLVVSWEDAKGYKDETDAKKERFAKGTTFPNGAAPVTDFPGVLQFKTKEYG